METPCPVHDHPITPFDSNNVLDKCHAAAALSNPSFARGHVTQHNFGGRDGDRAGAAAGLASSGETVLPVSLLVSTVRLLVERTLTLTLSCFV